MHLHLPRRRAEPDRPLRPQARAEPARRPTPARVVHEECPVRLHSEGVGDRDGLPPGLLSEGGMWDGTLRPAPEPRPLCR